MVRSSGKFLGKVCGKPTIFFQALNPELPKTHFFEARLVPRSSAAGGSER